ILFSKDDDSYFLSRLGSDVETSILCESDRRNQRAYLTSKKTPSAVYSFNVPDLGNISSFALPHSSKMRHIQCGKDPDHILVFDATLASYDMKTSSVTYIRGAHDQSLIPAGWLPDGDILAVSVDAQKTLYVIDAQRLQIKREIRTDFEVGDLAWDESYAHLLM